MINLLEETLRDFEEENLKEEDVLFVANSKRYCSFDEFKTLAQNINYDNDGYGCEEIHRDLVIVFKDGTWFSRGEYDGTEWWEYHKVPQKPATEGVQTIHIWRG